MSNENAGSIYVELRAQIDKLQADLVKSTDLIKKFETHGAKPTTEKVPTMFEQMGKNIGQKINNLSNNTVSQFLKMGKGIQSALMAAPIIGAVMMIVGAIGKLINKTSNFLNETTTAYHNQQKRLATLNTVIKQTGATAWTSSMQMNTMAKSLSKSTGFAINDINEMQSRLLTYTKITGENFERTQKAALDMAAIMGMDVSAAAETLGKALDSPIEGLTALTRQGFRFSDQIKEQIKSLTEQGKIAEAQRLILKDVEEVYKGIASAQENATGNSGRLKNVSEELNAELGRTSSGITNWWRSIQISVKETRLMGLQHSRLGDELIINRNKIKQYEQGIKDLTKTIGEASGEELTRLREELEKLHNELNKLTENEDIWLTQLESANISIDLHLSKLGGVEAWISEYFPGFDLIGKGADELKNTFITLWRIVRGKGSRHVTDVWADELEKAYALKAEAEERLKIIKSNKRELEGETDSLAQIEAEQEKVLNLAKQITLAEQKRRDTIAIVHTDLGNKRITEEEAAERIKAAYTNEANQIATIRQELYKLKDEFEKTGTAVGKAKVGEVIASATQSLGNAIFLERTRRNEIERTNAKLKANNTLLDEGNQIRLKELSIRMEAAQSDIEKEKILNEIYQLEEEIALAKLRQSDYYTGLLSGLKQGTAEYEAALALQLELEESTKRLLNLQKEVNKKTNTSKKDWMSEKFHEVLDNIIQITSAVGTAINSIGDFLTDKIQKNVDAQLKALDELYNGKGGIFELLEKEKQQKLYDMGFIEAQTEEQHRRELELAIESGDHQRIFKAQNELEKFQIEEEFALKKAELERAQKKEQLQLEHQAALAQWRMQQTMAIVTGAQSILQAANNSWPMPAVPMMAAATIATGVQIGIIAKNKPKLQQFRDGGIVDGSMLRGDRVATLQNSREMDLTLRQQKNLFNAIDNNELGGSAKEQIINITVPVTLDGKQITKIVVQHINNRQELIDKRSIR